MSKVEICDVCKSNKENVNRIKTYNREFVDACPFCAEEMALTLRIMMKSADWFLEHRDKSGKYVKTSKIGVVTSISTTS